MSLEKQALGTKATPLNTGSTLTNNSLALSAALDNTVGGTFDGYTRAIFTLAGTWGTAPAAGTGLSVWLLASDDGAGGNYEDGGSSVTPARAADFVIPVQAINTAQVVARISDLPPGKFKMLAKNDGTGQTLNSGWTITLTPTTSQLV